MTDLRYRAFVSYSHASDAQLAASLQSSLSRFAKPWYRLRTMRVFLDKTSLSANPALWPTIEQALGQSEYFLLLASPTSANSVWVQQEVRWWLQNKTAEKLVVCLTDGVILWDNKTGDFDWDKTNAVPAILKGAFPSEPLYADFRAAKAANKYAKSDPAFRDALLILPLHCWDGRKTIWTAKIFVSIARQNASPGPRHSSLLSSRLLPDSA